MFVGVGGDLGPVQNLMKAGGSFSQEKKITDSYIHRFSYVIPVHCMVSEPLDSQPPLRSSAMHVLAWPERRADHCLRGLTTWSTHEKPELGTVRRR